MRHTASASQEHVQFDFVVQHLVQGLSISCKLGDLEWHFQINFYGVAGPGKRSIKMFVIETVLGEMSETLKNSFVNQKQLKY